MSVMCKALVILILALSVMAFVIPALAQTASTSSSRLHSGFGTSGASYGGFGSGGTAPTYGSTGLVYGADFAPKFQPNPWSHCAVGNVGCFINRGLSAKSVLGWIAQNEASLRALRERGSSTF